MPVEPVRETERIGLIDALRGFALFGVLTMNLGLFTGRWGMPQPVARALPTYPLDQVFNVLTMIFFAGKSIAIFSFLFGVGFAVYLSRNDARLWARRVGILLAIGLIHAFGIWAGDILALYAACGFALIVFKDRSQKTLVILACVFMAVVGLQSLIYMWMPAGARPGPVAWQLNQAPTWPEAFLWNARLFAAYHLHPAAIIFAIALIGHLMLGYAAGRARVFHEPDEHRRLFRRLLVIGLCVEIPTVAFGLIMFVTTGGRRPPPALRVPLSFLEETATLAMATIYVAAITLLYRRPGFRRLVAPLEAVGRMALTNYLTQSVVCTLVMYRWPGLGFAGKVASFYSFLFGVGLYSLQVVFSRFWLARFRFGPMEWVWRSLTYGAPQPMRRPAPAVEPATM